MSNSIIPHFVSDSPPPIANNDEEDYDDEFGDFTGPGDLSFDNDLSSPSTPKNSNNSAENYSAFEMNKIENNYERNIKTDDKSTKHFISNEVPTKNYINILDHLENNALKIVNGDKEDILKVNNEVEAKLKDSSTVKVLNQSKCEEENGEDNFPDSVIFTKSLEEIEKRINDPLVETHVVSNEKSDCVDSSDEDELRKETDITNFSEVPHENLSGIVDEVFHDSKDYFGDLSVLRSDNINDNSELGNKTEKSRIEDDLEQLTHHNDDSIANCNSEKFYLQDLSKDGKIVADETLNYVPTFGQENIDNTELEPYSETIDEFSDCKGTTNNIDEEHEEVCTRNTISLTSDKSEHSHEIFNSNLKEMVKDNSSVDNTQSERCETARINGDDDDFDEFADFKTSKLDSNTNVFGVEQVEDDFAEFGDFENCNNINESKNSQNGEDETVQDRMEPKQIVAVDDEVDDFDEFADYSTFSRPNNDTDDDFDNFCDFSTFNRQNSENSEMSGSTIKICKGPEEAFDQSQIILEDMFVPIKSDMIDYINSDMTLVNSVFENLKDITDTNALLYHWEKSTAQKNILKTLNIDIRNILYGPTWNAGIPIFAANLCSTPLEPIKSEVNHSASPHKVVETFEADRSSLSTDFPLAEFDWSGAGLTNPLDSFGTVEKESETSDATKSASDKMGIPSTTSVTSNKIFSSQDQQHDASNISVPYINETSNSEHFEQIVKNEDDFSDFTSYQPNIEQDIKWTGKMLPLRESHISYQPSSLTEESSIAQATMKPSSNSSSSFNLDLSFLESKFESFTSTETAEVTGSSKPVDYTDVKLFSPIENKLNVEEHLASFDDFKSFKTETKTQQLHNLHNSEIGRTSATISNETSDVISQTTEIITKIKETSTKKPYSNENTLKESSYQEDEFTDFHSSSSNQVNLPRASTLSFPEPLKPAVLQPVPLNSAAKIQWPEPGLDEGEISRIVAGCLRRKSETETEIVRKNELVAGEQEKKDTKKVMGPQPSMSSNDDEEWSDFVSVKETAKSRTATPDLPLSVFNLGSIQPVKAPTPVVTPNGLICSPVKNSLPNMSVPKSNVNLQRNIQHHSSKHPFITSQVFDALYQNPRKNITLVNNSFSEAPRQINQSCRNCKDQKTNIFDTYIDTTAPNVSNIGYVTPQNETNYGKFQSSLFSVPKSSGDDDEWGDFVSANSGVPPYNSNFNSVHSSTRIITNPSHFMGAFNKSVSSEHYASSNKGTVVRQERRNIPSISALPDLDFVSPRTRGVKK